MRRKLVIFDLDGTLADSFPWFLLRVNDVADRFGFRRINEEDVPVLRNCGTREILNRMAVPLVKLPLIARHMRRLKAQSIDEIRLFPGIDAMLRSLAESGVSLALVSSDDEANARRQLGPELAELFGSYACGASIFGKAPKFRRVIRRSHVERHDTIAVGDELRDLEAARAAGIAFGAVRWGYADPQILEHSAPDVLFQTPADIADHVLGDRLRHV